MERPLTHTQMQEQLGAYALDAVDRDEAEAIERHLAECPRCFDEVTGHREAAALLAHVGAPAPAGVWDKIAAHLDERDAEDAGAGASRGEVGDEEAAAAAAAQIAGLPDAGGRDASAGAGGADAGGAAGEAGAGAGRGEVGDEEAGAAAAGAAGVAGGGSAGLGPAGRRGGGTGPTGTPPAGTGPGRGRAGGRRPIPVAATRWLAGALAAAAVIVAVLGVQLLRIDNRLDRLTALREDSLDKIALAAFADPNARQVRLASDDGAKVADAALLPDGQAYLIARSLPSLSAAETYQLWAVVGDQKISVAVLGNKPTVAAFHYNAEPSVLAITAEKPGGVVASEKQAVVVGFVEPKSA